MEKGILYIISSVATIAVVLVVGMGLERQISRICTGREVVKYMPAASASATLQPEVTATVAPTAAVQRLNSVVSPTKSSLR